MKENVGPLVYGAWNMVTEDIKKLEAFNAFFAYTFICQICFQKSLAQNQWGNPEQGRTILDVGGSG